LIALNYRDARPIYQQIKDGLRKLIISGAMLPGEKLQSVRSLAMELSINPNTIQRAYNELEAEGYIISVAGKGSFVAQNLPAQEDPRVIELSSKLAEITKELKFLGMAKNDILDIAESAWNTEEKK